MMDKNLIILLLIFWDVGLANYLAWKEGDDAYISCNVTNKTNEIRKDGSVILDIEDVPIKLLDSTYKNRVKYEETQRKSSGHFNFTLLNVTSSDAGTFECLNEHSLHNCSQDLVIAMQPSDPKVECIPELPVEDYNVTLTCNSSSKSLPQGHGLVMKYSWRKNDENCTTQQADGMKLTFTVRKADRGDNYSCQAFEEGLASQWSSNFTLLPQYGPDSIRISSTSVLEGDQVTCSADCNPDCNITWSGGDGQVTTGRVRFSMDRGQSETNCTAWNVHGHKSRSYNVNVSFPPELSYEDGNKTTHEAGSLTLTWLVNSNPEPKVTIHSPNGTGTPMTTPEDIHDNNYKISYTIDSARCDDHGHYEITAGNNYGSTHLSVAVVVLCSPRLFPKPKPVQNTDDNTWSFMIQAYPKPTLEAIFSMSPGGDSKATSPPHKHIPNERQTEDGLTTRSNLHEFHVDFPCESLGVKYLLTFINSEGKRNISFSLEEDHCKANTSIMITVVIVIIILVLILLTSGLVIYRRRKRAGQRRYSPHGTANTTRNNTFRQEYATVPRKTDRPAKDVYAKVKKGKSIVCKNKVYDGAGNSSREALIVRRASPSGEGALNNCGERNEDGLIYADLDLLPPTLNNGSPVIVGTREETAYVDIDFTKTPGPQLPDKIWEVEKK